MYTVSACLTIGLLFKVCSNLSLQIMSSSLAWLLVCMVCVATCSQLHEFMDEVKAFFHALSCIVQLVRSHWECLGTRLYLAPSHTDSCMGIFGKGTTQLSLHAHYIINCYALIKSKLSFHALSRTTSETNSWKLYTLHSYHCLLS